MIVILTKDWTNGQGKKLKAGDKIDCCRDTYNRLIDMDACEVIKGEAKKKKIKKTKKVENGRD